MKIGSLLYCIRTSPSQNYQEGSSYRVMEYHHINPREDIEDQRVLKLEGDDGNICSWTGAGLKRNFAVIT